MKKKVTSAALAAAMLAGTFTPAAMLQPVGHAQTQSKIEQAMQQLTSEQRRAIQDLTSTVQSGLQLSPDMDLSSDKEVSVIVEFKNKPAQTAVLVEKLNGREMSVEEANDAVEKEHGAFKKDLEDLHIKGKITKSYSQVYNGVALTLPANEIKNLLKSKAVKNVWENQEVQSELPVASEEQKAPAYTPYTGNSPSETLGVDKLHKEGITGKGVKVAVLDTGIDYNHPDLKDAFKGGYDFVDEDNDPMEATYEDWQKSGQPEFLGSHSYYTVHGTHVSGIIAGQHKNDAQFAMEGIAPDADLYVYRVLGPYGRGTTEDIMAGIEQSVKDKMDVINLSLGNDYNDPLSPISVAINNAALSGVTAVLAAGNAGSSLYTIGSPAASPLAITVGSTDTEIALPNFIGTIKSESGQITTETRYIGTGFLADARLLKGQTLEMKDVKVGKEEDYVGVDIEGNIALVSTGGGLTVQQKVKIAKEKGAAAIFIYSQYGSGYIGDKLPDSLDNIPAQSMDGKQGKALVESLKTEAVFFTFDEVKENTLTSDDVLSYFSSRGPARNTYDIKPEVVAPGGTIMSTVPSYYQGKDYVGNYSYAYTKLSGTSMATPHVAGVAALLLQANPKFTPGDVKSSLMNTADALQSKNSVYESGAGRVDAYEAVHTAASFEVEGKTITLSNSDKEKNIKEITGALSFGTFYGTENGIEDEKNITVTNYENQDKTYEVKVNYQALRGSINAEENGVVLETPSFVTIKAGGKETVAARINIPSSAQNGTYEGFVTFTNKENADEVYQIPFAVRKVKEGVEFVQMGDNVTTIKEDGSNSVTTSLSSTFRLNSHMKSIDTFLTDAETGEDLGFLGQLDGNVINENTTISLYGIFAGKYYPFTNDKENPIAYEAKAPEPGTYKVKLVFTDDRGKETVIEKPFVLDNEMPTLETDLEEGIVEVDSATPTIEVNGTVHDKQIDDAVAIGSAVKQGNNRLYYRYSNSSATQTSLDENGSFNFIRAFPSYLKVLPVSFQGKDRVGLPTVQKEFYFVKKGTNYIATVANQKEVQTGDTISFTSTAHNSTSWMEAKWNYQFNKAYLEVEGIEVSKELTGKVSVETKETSSGLAVTVKALQGAISPADMLPLLHVKAKVKDDKFINDYASMAVVNAVYTDATGTNTKAESAHPSVKIWAKHSELQANIDGEAIYARDPYGKLLTTYVDYFALGAKIRVKDGEGNWYEGKVLPNAKFEIRGLPSDRKPLTFQLDIPGHFTVEKTFTIGREQGLGELQYFSFKTAIAGDVNKDNVIDIQDAVYVKDHWNTSDRNADINFDGTVDMKDMEYIKLNYLLENPTVQPSKKPSENAHGKRLEDILEELN
ncbi:S8 family serine peptidase [Bacillus sp. 165]|uniref:S8 family serine peptidase n=1 Tax=Bacillus sp. 165 TaxID=1529117 RepID=UPI001AD9E9C7|nr:S8 family serine peptidase [Bacillus sp. 165]MBO9130412.1 S8 family serine peptidase [Bacillus sp. 165]